jgi:hypothetical protein
MFYDYHNGYNQIKPFIEKQFKNAEQTAIVLTDPVMNVADYMMQWIVSKVRFVNERSPIIPYRDEAQQYFVYHNGLTWWLTGIYKGGPMIMWNFKEPYIKRMDSIAGNELYSVVYAEKMNRPVSFFQYFNDLEWVYIPHFNSTS